MDKKTSRLGLSWPQYPFLSITGECDASSGPFHVAKKDVAPNWELLSNLDKSSGIWVVTESHYGHPGVH